MPVSDCQGLAGIAAVVKRKECGEGGGDIGAE